MAPGTTSRAVAALAAATIAIGGCGGDDEPSPGEAARQAADGFAGAMADGNFEAACAAMTAELRSELGGEDCPEQVGGVAGEGVAISVTAVRVSGPKAVAETEVRREGAPSQESSFDLVEAEGTWEVSELGG